MARLVSKLSRDNLKTAPIEPAVSPNEHRRTSSEATPRPSMTFSRPSDSGPPADPSKRLGFFGDKTGASSASRSGGATPLPASLLPPRSHSRADSAMSNISRDTVYTTTTVSPGVATPRVQQSPSKSTISGRTYDSKLVQREMARLGNLAGIPTLAPAILASASAAASTISLPTSTVSVLPSGAHTNEAWGALHVHLLPLFNGEPLRVPIEDLNALVRKHIGSVVSSSPSKAFSTLENEVGELIGLGMVTLKAKLTGIEDDKLIGRVVEIWGFFWDQILTYIEGSLLPLQTSPLLQSLNARKHANSSKGSLASFLPSTVASTSAQIDVRTIALRAFRDRIILPVSKQLAGVLSITPRGSEDPTTPSYEQGRLQQMFLVLVSQGRQHPSTFSLTEPAPAPSPGEAAAAHLLRTLRAPLLHSLAPRTTRAPSFLSAKRPRDRRGRIGPRTGAEIIVEDTHGEAGLLEQEREADREFLEALRSPTSFPDQEPPRQHTDQGGWALEAVGGPPPKHMPDDDEDEEPLGWGEAQVVVEHMVGINSKL